MRMSDGVRVYGSRVSYFTGKLEAYLRYKGIPYELLPLVRHAPRFRAAVGTSQMPVVELADGRLITDTTPILQYFEREFPDAPVMPADPAVRFIALLIEDYGDEWLWRPAMHYRWSYRHDRELLSSLIVDEQLEHMRLPRFAKRRLIQRRQRRGFVIGDGVSNRTRAHVEAGYFRALENITAMLQDRRFLLGNAPSIADIGLMGPMLRHFGQDPTPAELMRTRAPAVYAWVGRSWSACPSPTPPKFVHAVPNDAAPMLQEIAQTHLAQLAANAAAYEAGQRRFDATFQGCSYSRLPVSRYRVWCLERLRAEFAALGPVARDEVRSRLPVVEASILWREDFSARSGYDEACEAPFNQAINVYGKGVPR